MQQVIMRRAAQPPAWRVLRRGAQAHVGLVRGRWTFGNALYPAGNYKGMANLKWTCKSPCTSRNYLIQVPLRPA